MSDPQQLADTIRDALIFMRDCGDRPGMYDAGDEALAALAALLARVEAAEHSIACADTPLMRDVLAERDAARARLAQATEALRGVEKIAAEHEGITPDAYELISDATRAALIAVEEREGA